MKRSASYVGGQGFVTDGGFNGGGDGRRPRGRIEAAVVAVRPTCVVVPTWPVVWSWPAAAVVAVPKVVAWAVPAAARPASDGTDSGAGLVTRPRWHADRWGCGAPRPTPPRVPARSVQVAPAVPATRRTTAVAAVAAATTAAVAAPVTPTTTRRRRWRWRWRIGLRPSRYDLRDRRQRGRWGGHVDVDRRPGLRGHADYYRSSRRPSGSRGAAYVHRLIERFTTYPRSDASCLRAASAAARRPERS